MKAELSQSNTFFQKLNGKKCLVVHLGPLYLASKCVIYTII